MIRRATALVLVALAGAALACDRRAGPDERPGARPGPADGGPPRAGRASAPEGAAVERPAQEATFALPESGDLAAEVAAFPGLETCTATLRRTLPPPVDDVLDDVGYGRLAEDGCRALEAMALREIGRCDGLELRVARLGCRRRYAMLHGEPSSCPREPSKGGRDPTCVAVAMRDPSMCLAEGDRGRVGVCRAIVLRSERPCRVASENAGEVAACVVAARRYWSAMPERTGRPALPPGFEPFLELRRGPAAPDAPLAEAERSRLLDRGIVVEGGRLLIGARSQPPILSPPPALEIGVPATLSGEGPWTLEVGPMGASVWLEAEGEAPVDSAADEVAGTVELDRLGAARGAIVSGEAHLELRPAIGPPTRLEARFLTFVRDVVDGEASDAPEERDQ